jgi:hypothetical protein
VGQGLRRQDFGTPFENYIPIPSGNIPIT